MNITPFRALSIKRKSVRNYLERPISDDKIDVCLEAARLSQSACNSQPWKFIVVKDKTLKDRLCREAFSGPYSMNKFAIGAPVIIAVVSEKSTFFAKIGGQFRGTQYCLIDIGIVCEDLTLQAAELNIGSCLLGWFDEKAVKRLLKIPRQKKVDLLISLGYYEPFRKIKTRKSLDEIRSFNKY